MRKTNKKLVNLMMAGVMAAGVIMAPASTHTKSMNDLLDKSQKKTKKGDSNYE